MTTTHPLLALADTPHTPRGDRVVTSRVTLACATILAVAASMHVTVSAAQDAPAEPESTTAEPSAQQRQAAAEAYDRGTAAYLSRDYVAAARWFETAHRMAPAAPALLQAVRANQRAENTLRASNLALRLQIQYGQERSAARVAEPIVAAANRAYVRVDVTCASCTVDLDGTLQEWTSFYLEPGGDHIVGAHFETGDAEAQHVSGAAGSQKALSFTAPPPPPPEADPQPTRGWPAAALRRREAAAAAAGATATADGVGQPNERDAPPPAESGGLSPVLFIVSAGLTVAAGGVLVWSGLDTTAGVADYEASPTQEALDAGQGKELRTNILIAGTAVLGATTLVFALLTNWGGRNEARSEAARRATPTLRAGIAPVEGGAVGVLGGRF